jgi:hypothetical protein
VRGHAIVEGTVSVFRRRDLSPCHREEGRPGDNPDTGRVQSSHGVTGIVDRGSDDRNGDGGREGHR